MKNSKGFTLIELLVVIAIIGILASVVLASLNSARSKGSDAAIQSSINNARAQAELYASDHSNSYVGVCDNGIKNMIDGAKNAGSAAVACGEGTGGWALSAQLKSDTAKYFCVDSSGVSTSSTAAIVSGATDTSCNP